MSNKLAGKTKMADRPLEERMEQAARELIAEGWDTRNYALIKDPVKLIEYRMACQAAIVKKFEEYGIFDPER